jgi:hypothetical protein
VWFFTPLNMHTLLSQWLSIDLETFLLAFRAGELICLLSLQAHTPLLLLLLLLLLQVQHGELSRLQQAV